MREEKRKTKRPEKKRKENKQNWLKLIGFLLCCLQIRGCFGPTKVKKKKRTSGEHSLAYTAQYWNRIASTDEHNDLYLQPAIIHPTNVQHIYI